jgi:hypothetical protein
VPKLLRQLGFFSATALVISNILAERLAVWEINCSAGFGACRIAGGALRARTGQEARPTCPSCFAN